MAKKTCSKCGVEENRGRTCEGKKLCNLRCYKIAVEERLAETYKDSTTANPSIEILEGSKNWKFVETVYGSRSVHSFINRETGDILKPATWNAPAKHARGNIFDADCGRGALTAYGIRYLK